MRYALLILFLLPNLSCEAQTSKKFNFDFEQFQTGTHMADGWFRWSDYESTTVTESHSGKYAGKITSDEMGIEGRIAYVIPANYEGDTIQLEGYMKIKNVEGYAGLLIRIESTVEGYPGFVKGFGTMERQNVNGTKDWQKYSISLPLPKNSDYIFIGGILSGKGEAWFDDFIVTIDGQNIETLPQNDRIIFNANLDKEFDMGSTIDFTELDAEAINNLELLGKIWGFLKYHHPEVGKGNYNWDYELFRVLPEYLKVSTKKQRDEVLIKWITSYGKLEKCTTCKVTSSEAFLKPDRSWIENGAISEELKVLLNGIYLNRHQGEHFYVKMTENVKNPQFLNENQYALMAYPDKGFRLLTLYKYWNIIQYFFPYKHLTDKNWNLVLKEYVQKFLNAQDELEYELAALQLIGEVNDTHANLWGGANRVNEKKGKYYPPFRTRFVEGKLVVTDYFNPEIKYLFELSIGDIITHINGKEVDSIVDTIKRYYPASNDAARMRDIASDLLRSKEEEINIDYISGSKRKEKKVKLYEKHNLNYEEFYRNDGRKSFRLVDENIGYITLQSLKREEIDTVMNRFKNTKGIIVDIRNYPNTFVPFTLGPYFVSSTTPFVKFTKGNTDNPGEFTFTEVLKIPESSDTYDGKLIILVNELSQSQSEYTTMAFRAGDNTTVIGSTTAGADGNISSIYLPGGLSTSISGIGVYYPNGTETQRVGIVPDIEIKPTIEGIKNGKDELLLKAIEIIND